MRFILAVLIILMPPLLFAAEPVVVPQPDGSLVITLPAEVVEKCEAEGGCRVMSRDQLIKFIEAIKPKLCDEVGI